MECLHPFTDSLGHAVCILVDTNDITLSSMAIYACGIGLRFTNTIPANYVSLCVRCEPPPFCCYMAMVVAVFFLPDFSQALSEPNILPRGTLPP